MATYVLITSARNEEPYLGRTIESVLNQSVLPEKWVIVNDGSTDRTGQIITSYADRFSFIQPVNKPNDSERNFGSKARSIRIGYEHLKNTQYAYIGNLDADISLPESYYSDIMSRFRDNPKLGLAGGIRYDLHDGVFRKVRCSPDSVGGPFQFFRRECYEAIDGYLPLKYGGIDAVAETMVRMHGWEVNSFPEIVVYHYRSTGTAAGGPLDARFRNGIRDYLIGYHPLFQALRISYRMMKGLPPLEGVFWIGGYVKAALLRYEKPVPKDFIRYLRGEQRARLRTLLSMTPHSSNSST